jgi:hypothetical protein
VITKRQFEVLAVGVPERELRILRTVALLSQGRACAYTLADGARRDDPDILAVDGESGAALAARAANGRWSATPTLFLGKGDASCPRSVVVPRPLVPLRVLAALQDVTQRFVTVAPESLRRSPSAS